MWFGALFFVLMRSQSLQNLMNCTRDNESFRNLLVRGYGYAVQTRVTVQIMVRVRVRVIVRVRARAKVSIRVRVITCPLCQFPRKHNNRRIF